MLKVMKQSTDSIQIVIITGSVRPGNYTNMAAALVLDEFKKYPNVPTEMMDPATLSLPPPGTDPQSNVPKYLQQKVRQATGVILATQESFA